MTNLTGKIFSAALLTAISGAAIFLLLMALGPDWSKYAPASCKFTRCFCELPRTDALILQPSNSWSSLGFIFAGFLMIIMARTRGLLSAFPPLASSVFGATAILVGLGSMLLHATLTLWGQFFDVLGMYLISSFLLVSALAKWRDIPGRRAVIYYLALFTALVTILFLMPEVRRWLYAVVLMTAIILELGFARPLRHRVETRFYFYGIAANIVAFAIWNLDQSGQLCNPHSIFQGHAIWHLLGALALWFMFLYYRSERDNAIVA